MPIGASPTYPTVADVMNLARSYVNDTMPGATNTPGEGQILTNDAPFTVPFLNAAIRELYRELGNNGVATVINDNVIITGLTPVPNAPNPAIQVSVTYQGYFDGTTLFPSQALSVNCLSVLKLWERPTNSNLDFREMTQTQFGLPSRYQQIYLGDWEYRQDGIYMVGATQTTDIRMRQVIQLNGAISGNGSDFENISIPVLDCEDAIAYKVAAKVDAMLGDESGSTNAQNAVEAVRQLANRQIRQKQAIQYERQPYGGGSTSYGGWSQ